MPKVDLEEYTLTVCRESLLDSKEENIKLIRMYVVSRASAMAAQLFKLQEKNIAVCRNMLNLIYKLFELKYGGAFIQNICGIPNVCNGGIYSDFITCAKFKTTRGGAFELAMYFMGDKYQGQGLEQLPLEDENMIHFVQSGLIAEGTPVFLCTNRNNPFVNLQTEIYIQMSELTITEDAVRKLDDLARVIARDPEAIAE